MKILIFYQYFGTPKGGWSTRYYEFTKRWVANGNEVTVVTSPYYKSDIKTETFLSRQQIEGINLIVIDLPDSNKHSFLRRAWNALRFSIVSIYFALSESHDVVISSSGPITTALPGLFSKWFRGKKLVFEVRDLWPKGGIELGKIRSPLIKSVSLWFERLIYNQSDLVISCSEGMQSGILEVNPKVKTLNIPNSSDLELFSDVGEKPDFPKGFQEDLPLFIYAGSLGLMDDCRQILEGAKLVNGLNFNLVFIGDGAEREELEKFAKDHKLLEKVFFLGLIPKTEVVKWFSLAKASFVTFKDLPVLHTNSPNKMFDSFAAGVPIIQSTRGWIYDLVRKSECGLNVDPADPESFAKAMIFLIENSKKAAEMGQNARRLAQHEFNRSVLAEKYLEGLKEVVL